VTLLAPASTIELLCVRAVCRYLGSCLYPYNIARALIAVAIVIVIVSACESNWRFGDENGEFLHK